ncbi:MAG: sodium-dependent transporter, partial [Lentisphaerae bacterium]|nr:sodium-dependent transporter [Lentisphaerota bacterium]
GFVLAAVGSAVGLGNLWAFPYKLYAYGGGAFLIPYVAALLLVGIPLLILEFSLGHYAQRAAPDAFGRIHPRFETVGWWAVILSFVIITYYPVILAYCFTFLWHSLKGIFNGGVLPWAGEGIEGVTNAKTFFFEQYLGHWGSLKLGPIRPAIVLPLGIAWITMYLCIFRGVRFVGKIVWFTVPLPWIMLLILTVRGLTLQGSAQGLAFYLNPSWGELAKPATWRFAFGQVFFSLSLAFGVMITYASFLHRKSDINNNAAIIGLADLATSFVAGLAVFATLGGMAFATQQAGNPVPVANVVGAGPGLAFVAFPYALAQLPYSAWFSFIFFLALVTLGIDSAFSITESCLAAIVDKTGWRRNVVLPVLSLVGFGIGLVYVTRGGLNWVGIIDGFINGTWGIAFMGLLQCLVLGWLYRVDTLRKHANDRSDWRLGAWWNGLVRVGIPLVLGSLVFWSLFDDVTRSEGFVRSPEGSWHIGNMVGLAVVVAAPLLALLFSALKGVRPDPARIAREIGKAGLGRAGLVAGLLSAAIVPVVFVVVRRAARVSSEAPDTPLLSCLGVAAVLGIAGIILSQRDLVRHTSDQAEPSWLTRWAGIISTLGAGAALGLLLAVAAKGSEAAEKVTVRATSLTAAGYVSLGAIACILVTGLAWCLYRTMSGNAGSAPDGAEPVLDP